MAIVTEVYKTRYDGVILIRTYSDSGKMIERDGVRYAEAIDPEKFERVYIETDEPIEAPEKMSETEEKAMAYDIIMGVVE